MTTHELSLFQQRWPVEHERDGRRGGVFSRCGEHEPLPVTRNDIVISHANQIGGMREEKGRRRGWVKPRLGGDRHGHEHAIGPKVKEFLAITTPVRISTAEPMGEYLAAFETRFRRTCST